MYPERLIPKIVLSFPNCCPSKMRANIEENLRMEKQRRKTIWIVLLLILTTGLIFAKPILRAMGEYLVVDDELQKADLITSVSGPDYRALYAAQLCKDSYAPRLFYTGGYNEFDERYAAAWSLYLATTIGVPPEEITADETAVVSTYEEAERVKAYVDARPGKIDTIIVVTDPYHTRRTKWAYERVLGDEITILMAPVPFEETGYSSSWWRSSYARQMVFEEYLKYGFYLLRYQWTSGPLQKLLAKFDRF